jgi:hypothetical protein
VRRAALAKLRLDAQRISATTFTRPAEVVAWLGAVQAQDYLGALWAVGLRLKEAREKDIEGALADRSIVRTWPMRRTLHFVAAADVRWMIDLLGPRLIVGAAGRLRALGIDDPTIGRARRVLLKRLAGGTALARAEVYQVLERNKISVADQRGIHILWRLAQEGLLCFGPREGKKQTFVLLDEWLPGERQRWAREEALAELARRYFTGHGPATAADFAWWSGLKLSDARHGVHLAGEHLHEATVGGQRHWFGKHASASPAASRARAYLLPAFDEFLVAYADRSAAVEPAHTIRVNTGGGILKPTIVVDGFVVGTWKRRFVRGECAFSPELFGALSEPKRRAVGKALRRYGEFLGVEAREET